MRPTFIARFTPSLMPPETLEAIFVQRQELASRLVSLLRDSVKTPAKHHALLIGPRGIGKTHLVALIYHRLQAEEDLRPASLVAWLREEEWGVDSFLDLLMRIFRALDVAYPHAQLAERTEPLYELPPDEAERAAAALLKEFAAGRTLVLLVENLNELFAGLGEKGQQRLRAYIQENPFCTILATAQALFNGVSLQTSPFYGFFRIHVLVRMMAHRWAEKQIPPRSPLFQRGEGSHPDRIILNPSRELRIITLTITLFPHSPSGGVEL